MILLLFGASVWGWSKLKSGEQEPQVQILSGVAVSRYIISSDPYHCPLEQQLSYRQVSKQEATQIPRPWHCLEPGVWTKAWHTSLISYFSPLLSELHLQQLSASFPLTGTPDLGLLTLLSCQARAAPPVPSVRTQMKDPVIHSGSASNPKVRQQSPRFGQMG